MGREAECSDPDVEKKGQGEEDQRDEVLSCMKTKLNTVGTELCAVVDGPHFLAVLAANRATVTEGLVSMH